MDDKANFQLIDVREQYEYDEANMGAQLIPMGEIVERMDEIAKDKQVVVHCRSGARSANIINYLETQGYDNLYNLEGGIMAWLAM
jgi:adenylyltransferase/sulfurtransferase